MGCTADGIKLAMPYLHRYPTDSRRPFFFYSGIATRNASVLPAHRSWWQHEIESQQCSNHNAFDGLTDYQSTVMRSHTRSAGILPAGLRSHHALQSGDGGLVDYTTAHRSTPHRDMGASVVIRRWSEHQARE